VKEGYQFLGEEMPKTKAAFTKLESDANLETVIFAVNGCMADVASLKDGQAEAREFILKICAGAAAVGALISTGPTGVEWFRHLFIH